MFFARAKREVLSESSSLDKTPLKRIAVTLGGGVRASIAAHCRTSVASSSVFSIRTAHVGAYRTRLPFGFSVKT